jgi:hypothetical protein
MTMATTNEMHHCAPSTLLSNPPLREGKGKGKRAKMAVIFVGGGGKGAIVTATINHRR